MEQGHEAFKSDMRTFSKHGNLTHWKITSVKQVSILV